MCGRCQCEKSGDESGGTTGKSRRTAENSDVKSDESRGACAGCSGCGGQTNNSGCSGCGGCPKGSKGCCGDRAGQPGGAGQQKITITEAEYELLMELYEFLYLPLVRFFIAEPHGEAGSAVGDSVKLFPVYLEEGDETLEQARRTGRLLVGLQQKGLVSLDYGQPLQGCDYELYKRSPAYRIFEKTVREGCHREGLPACLPGLEPGSMSLTTEGNRAVEQICDN